MELHLETLHVDENSDETHSTVTLELREPKGGVVRIRGQGVGPVDATFNGLLDRYGVEYPSLKTIELVVYRVDGRMDTKKGKIGVDSLGEVSLGVKNSEGRLFEFSDESRSVSRSSVRAVLAAVEYFVNAERAFLTLYKARADAKERRRNDLVTRYTREMAEVVKSTSYAETIEAFKKEL